MFRIYETEEEQIAAIRNWWKENGLVTLIAVALTVGVYLGWNYYKESQENKIKSASFLYTQLLESTETDALDQSKIDELKKDYPKTQYAHFAAFLSAKKAVEKNDYAKAAVELQWVLDNKPDELTTAVTKLRLARVMYQLNQYDDALALLNNPEKGFEAGYAELSGDIYSAQNKIEDAKIAYQKALSSSSDEMGLSDSSFLQSKLDNLP